MEKKHQKRRKNSEELQQSNLGIPVSVCLRYWIRTRFFGMHIGVQITRNTSVCMPDMSVSQSAAFGQEGTSKKAADKYTKGLSKVAKSSLRVGRERSDLQKQQAAKEEVRSKKSLFTELFHSTRRAYKPRAYVTNGINVD